MRKEGLKEEEEEEEEEEGGRRRRERRKKGRGRTVMTTKTHIEKSSGTHACICLCFKVIKRIKGILRRR